MKPGNGRATLSWTASPDTTLVEIRRGTKRIYSGKHIHGHRPQERHRYRYTLTSYDEAANSSTSARPPGLAVPSSHPSPAP